MKHPRFLLSSLAAIVFMLMNPGSTWCGDAETQIFLTQIQEQQLTPALEQLYGIRVPSDGPADPKAFGEISDLLGDLTHRGESTEKYLKALAYAEDLLERLCSTPELLTTYNTWTGSNIAATGTITREEAGGLFGLTGETSFESSEYIRVLNKAIVAWRGICRLNNGEDFNLIYGAHIDPQAVSPGVDERGLIMGIVGGYWGSHLNSQNSFNYFRVLANAATYLRELQATPGQLSRYNRRFSKREIPPLPEQGPITDIRTREQLLFMVSEATLKRMPVRRYLSSLNS